MYQKYGTFGILGDKNAPKPPVLMKFMIFTNRTKKGKIPGLRQKVKKMRAQRQNNLFKALKGAYFQHFLDARRACANQTKRRAAKEETVSGEKRKKALRNRETVLL